MSFGRRRIACVPFNNNNNNKIYRTAQSCLGLKLEKAVARSSGSQEVVQPIHGRLEWTG